MLSPIKTANAPHARPMRPPEPPHRRPDAPDMGDLALDLGQIALDIVGIFEPTPFADLTNTAISLGRGDGWGALFSVAGVIPYIGDAAKLGKLGKWAQTVSNAVELAVKNSDAAKHLGPVLSRIAGALDSAPMSLFNKLPVSAQESLLNMRAQINRVPGLNLAGGAPGSLNHKAHRWSEYQDRGGEWGFERWSKTYDDNMVRARDAHRHADALHANRGWGAREVTLNVEMPDGANISRRLDIADVAGRRGIEAKSGYQYLSADNAWELQRDAELVKQGWDIEWVVDGTASQPLRDALERAGIKLSETGG